MHRINLQDYHALATKRGFEWLGATTPSSTKEHTLWRCTKGHEWTAKYSDILQNRGCPYCSYRVPKTAEDYHALAKERGYEWLGTVIQGTRATRRRTLWRCSCGHEWLQTYNGVKIYGCAKCAGKAQKTEADYHALAEQRGFQWIGETDPSGIFDKTAWRCDKGHEWLARYNNIDQGAGCPHCAGLARKTPEYYHELAASRGYEWIGVEAISIHHKTLWRCEYGHEWLSAAANIKKGNSCPFCDERVNGMYVSKPQIALHELLGGELNRRVGRLGIDVALTVDGVNIAVEFDSWYWHTDIERELKRDALLLSKGWRILHIKSANAIPAIEQIQAAIQLLLGGTLCTEIVMQEWLDRSVKH